MNTYANSMKNIKIHILVWVSYFLYTLISDFILGDFSNFYVYVVLFLTHNVFIFYSVVYCLKKASFNNFTDSLNTVLLFVAGFSSFAIVKFLYRVYLVKLLVPEIPPVASYFRLSVETAQWYLYIFLYALGYTYMINSIQKEKQLREMAQLNQMEAETNHRLQKENLNLEIAALSSRQEKLKNEQQHLQTEYAFLRSQINPHFLHNTLNFFYAKSLSGNTQELSESILILSDIMRYSLQKEETGTQEVSLDDEILHIRNVIKINQLRFDNRLNIQFTITGNTTNVRIIPLVMITLIENAFKHGDLNNPAFPLEIQILVTGIQLQCTVINNKKNGPRELSNGIGLNNIRRRLQIAYPGHCRLETTDGNTQFKATMTIDMHNDNRQAVLTPADATDH